MNVNYRTEASERTTVRKHVCVEIRDEDRNAAIGEVVVGADHQPGEAAVPKLTINTWATLSRECSAAIGEAIALAWSRWDERLGGKP